MHGGCDKKCQQKCKVNSSDHFSFHGNRFTRALCNLAVALPLWVDRAISAAQSIHIMSEIAPHEVVSTTS